MKKKINVVHSKNENDQTSEWNLIRKKMNQIINMIKEKNNE